MSTLQVRAKMALIYAHTVSRSMTALSKKRLTRVAALLLTAIVFIPAAAYFIGSTVVGPYEGAGGLAGYLGEIYLSAMRGERAALTLILSPLLIVIIWKISLLLFRRGQADAAI